MLDFRVDTVPEHLLVVGVLWSFEFALFPCFPLYTALGTFALVDF